MSLQFQDSRAHNDLPFPKEPAVEAEGHDDAEADAVDVDETYEGEGCNGCRGMPWKVVATFFSKMVKDGSHMGVEPKIKIGVKYPPKWMGKIMENPIV